MDPARLKGVPLFGSLSEQDLAAVAGQAGERAVTAGTVVAPEGDPGEEFFVIESGTAAVTRDGARLSTLGPGDFFGEIALLREERRVATVTATSPMVLIVMTGAAFRALDATAPAVREAVSRALADRQPIS
jgi:CRP-like cAMP-binding protein